MTQPFDLNLHHIRLTCEAVTTIHFGAHAGAQWRGALWDVLRDFACTDPARQGDVGHSWHCPMCFVLALEADSSRGVNPARPLIVRPPLAVRAGDDTLFMTGDVFTLELVLVGSALTIFPYLLQAVRRLGQQGIGFGRGRFDLQRVEAVNPITQTHALLYQAGSPVRMPGFPVTGEQVSAYADTLPPHRLHLHFLTPTQLVCDGQLLTRPQPDILVIRVLERLQSLELHYGTPEPQDTWKTRHEALHKHALNVRIRRDETRWIRAFSGSRRANRMQDVSGFVGSVLLEGDMTLLRLWLVWASLVNIGKNAIKGNGWMEIGG